MWYYMWDRSPANTTLAAEWDNLLYMIYIVTILLYLRHPPCSKSDGDDHEFQNDIYGTNRDSEHETTDDEENIPDSPNLF